MLRRHFRQVRFHGKFEDQGLPVLMVGNHFSWWDGFIAFELNAEAIGRKFHVMMLEEQLSERMFLNKAGAFSISPGSRSVRDSLEYTLSLLGDRRNMVVVYPQGKFQPMASQQVKFEKGIQHILKRVSGDVHLVFYVALVDYFEDKKPRLDIYFGQFEDDILDYPEEAEYYYNRFLAESINRQVPGT